MVETDKSEKLTLANSGYAYSIICDEILSSLHWKLKIYCLLPPNQDDNAADDKAAE